MRMLTDALMRRLEGIEDASKKGRRVRDLYRIMYEEDLWMLAYNNIRANDGALTKGVDESTLDGASVERFRGLVGQLRDESYDPKPVRRTYIPKANGKMRPLGVPTGDDKLAQEVARLLLERVYEPIFSDRSHGFRPGRSCHTALAGIPRSWKGMRWIVDVDIKGFFDSIDHDLLLKLLAKRIDDKRFINLIRKMLKAGYMEGWKLHNTYSGTPQGGIVSPILANVVLHELDEFMEEQIRSFDKGKRRKHNLDYAKLGNSNTKMRKQIKALKSHPGNEEEIARLRERIRQNLEAMREMPSKRMDDPNFKRLQYIRYADDFIIGVIGTKEDAEATAAKVKTFITERLHLEVNEEKTRVTHISDGCTFLGYQIRASKATGKVVKRSDTGDRVRSTTMTVNLFVPSEIAPKFCKEKGYGVYDRTKIMHRPYLLNSSEPEIIAAYNAELRGLANYYALACDVKRKLNKLFYMAHFSLFKTVATRRRITVAQVARHLRNGTNFTYTYEVNGKAMSITVYKLKHLRSKHGESVDVKPNTFMYTAKTELTRRMEAQSCEYCGAENVPCEVHHVRKLKDLKNEREPSLWKRKMIERQRKTLVLCKTCHRDLHSGTLRDIRFSS